MPTVVSSTVDLPIGGVHVSEAGDGEAVVLLHGGGAGATGLSNFSRNIDALAQHFRVIVPDSAGYGGTYLPSVEQIEAGIFAHNAAMLAQLLDHLNIERASLVGNSQGGAIAMRFALDHGDRVNRLVLMGPMLGGIAATTVEPTEGQRNMVMFFAPPGPSPDKLRKMLSGLVFDQSLITDELVDDRYPFATSEKSAAFFGAFAAAFQAGKGIDELWKEIDAIAHPTLLVWGRDDRVLPFDSALFMLKRMPDVRLIAYGNCGHWVQTEAADEFNAVVIAFLGGP